MLWHLGIYDFIILLCTLLCYYFFVIIFFISQDKEDITRSIRFISSCIYVFPTCCINGLGRQPVLLGE